MSAHDAQHTDRENARAVPSVVKRVESVKQVSSTSAQVVARGAGSPAEAQITGRGGDAVVPPSRKGKLVSGL